jgi:hypothetical protein
MNRSSVVIRGSSIQSGLCFRCCTLVLNSRYLRDGSLRRENKEDYIDSAVVKGEFLEGWETNWFD